ncbi:MAG TPA: hypothetical protein VGF45_04590 [Polyangia bacterium]
MNHDSDSSVGQILKHRAAKAKPVISCSTCGATVSELRRGRCWACYARWQEQRPVGLGASCAVCDERRRDNMRLVEVQGRSLALCHICAAHVARLDVVPYSVEGLRAALRRDRRHVERREGDPEQPHPNERRAASRRAGVANGIGALRDDLSVYKLGTSGLDLDLDLGEGEGEGAVEMTIDDADIVEDVTVIAMEPEAKAEAKSEVKAEAMAQAATPDAAIAPLETLAEAPPATAQADAG